MPHIRRKNVSTSWWDSKPSNTNKMDYIHKEVKYYEMMVSLESRLDTEQADKNKNYVT